MLSEMLQYLLMMSSPCDVRERLMRMHKRKYDTLRFQVNSPQKNNRIKKPYSPKIMVEGCIDIERLYYVYGGLQLRGGSLN